MDDSSRVGNVTTSTGISSSDSRDGSRGSTEGGEGGGGGDVGVAGSNRGDGSDSRGSIAETSIAVAKSGISETSISKTVSTIESVGLSLPLGNMDHSSRVSDISSSTGVGSTNSRDSGRGKASNVHGG